MSKEIQNEAYAITFKIALATSVIRMKPTHLTLRQYIYQLVNKLKSTENTWRSKAEQLQKKLDDARRETVLLQLKSDYLSRSKTSGIETDCIVHISKGSEENKIIPNKQKLLIEETSYKSCDQFLMAVTSFSNWYDALKKDENYVEVVQLNLKRCIKDLESSLHNISYNKHTVKVLESCMLNVVGFLQNEKFNCDVEVIKCCSHLGEVIIAMIMNTEEFSIKERLSHLLLQLSCSCPCVRDSCYSSLVKVVCAYSMLLRDLPSFCSLDCKKYESMFYICNTLREISISTLSKWSVQCLDEYSTSLDDNLLKIAESFPMYSHAVWGVSSIMADAQANEQYGISQEGISDVFKIK